MKEKEQDLTKVNKKDFDSLLKKMLDAKPPKKEKPIKPKKKS